MAKNKERMLYRIGVHARWSANDFLLQQEMKYSLRDKLVNKTFLE